jgi:hypothetical protein
MTLPAPVNQTGNAGESKNDPRKQRNDSGITCFGQLLSKPRGQALTATATSAQDRADVSAT